MLHSSHTCSSVLQFRLNTAILNLSNHAVRLIKWFESPRRGTDSCSLDAVLRQTSATSAVSLTSSITSVDSARVVDFADKTYQTNVFWRRPLDVLLSSRASCMHHMIVFQVRPLGGAHVSREFYYYLRRGVSFRVYFIISFIRLCGAEMLNGNIYMLNLLFIINGRCTIWSLN